MATAVATAAVLAAPGTGTADDAVTARTADGRALSVGSVVTQGHRDGDLCRFADGETTLALSWAGSGAGAVAVRANESCALVVTALGGGPDAGPTAPYRDRRKVESSSPAAARGAAVSGAGAFVAEAAPTTLTAYAVEAHQTVYRETGSQEYYDYTIADLFADPKTGGLWLGGGDGFCRSSHLDNTINDLMGIPAGHPWQARVFDCHYERRVNTPTYVHFVTGGYYRRVGPLGVVLDERELTEYFHAWSNGPGLAFDHTNYCTTGGTLPVEWTSWCKFRISRPETAL